MAVNEVIRHIDEEIAKLQQARALLAGMEASAADKPSRGRPKGSKNGSVAAPATSAKIVKRKRNLSPEGRKAIADAMKRRWAERRKETAK